jgi:Family of unknown function (DUF6335)
MSRKPKRRSDSGQASSRSADEELLGPPPAEALLEPSDLEGRAIEDTGQYSSTSPELSGGDLDADWRHADSSGEEALGEA